MAARRKPRRSSRRRGSGGSSLTWFGAGLVIGLALAVFAFHRGYLPAPPTAPASGEVDGSPSAEPELLEDGGELISGAPESRYDFFTVLPEMEVVVPERELSGQADTGIESTPAETAESYILQVGSFRNPADAEQMKARLALLGSVAAIQQVTVNDETWHRVRLGPIAGARATDEIRRRLQDNGIEVLVLKVSG